jgi:hypothetical protein
VSLLLWERRLLVWQSVMCGLHVGDRDVVQSQNIVEANLGPGTLAPNGL